LKTCELGFLNQNSQANSQIQSQNAFGFVLNDKKDLLDPLNVFDNENEKNTLRKKQKIDHHDLSESKMSGKNTASTINNNKLSIF